MNPFFFGSAERPLFGVHHPPRRRGPVARGAVLCYPFGVEYMRAHRAFRQLTTLLTRSHHHVLRFDYFGTGDSSGSGDEASLAQWREDIEGAIDELIELAGLRAATLIGLRLGATLALQVARDRPDVEHLVLWDPVVSGSAYVEEVLSVRAPDRRERAVGRPMGVGGFPLTAEMEAEMRAIDLLADGERAGARAAIDLVVSEESDRFSRLREALASNGRLRGYHLVPSAGNWARGDEFGSVILPQGIVQEIVAQVEGAAIP